MIPGNFVYADFSPDYYLAAAVCPTLILTDIVPFAVSYGAVAD
jgi:hypothetical protein